MVSIARSHRGPRRFLSLAGLMRSVFRYDEGCAIFTETSGNRHDEINRQGSHRIGHALEQLIYQSPTAAHSALPVRALNNFPFDRATMRSNRLCESFGGYGILGLCRYAAAGRVFFYISLPADRRRRSASFTAGQHDALRLAGALDRLSQSDQKHHALARGMGREKLSHIIIEER